MPLEAFVAGSPVLTGLAFEIAFVVGLAILRAPIEIAILILLPLNFFIVGFYIPEIIPVIAVVAGLYIGMMFLKVVRR
jgi:hypothetical protein